MIGMVEKMFVINLPQPFLSSFVFGIAPLWGCFYSHKSIGSEGLVVSPLWRVNVWLAFACLRGGGFGRKKAVF